MTSPLAPTQDLSNPESVHDRVHELMATGQVFLAHDLATAGLEKFPNAPLLILARALALTRTGAVAAARTLMEPLLQRSETQDLPPTLDVDQRMADIYLSIWQQTKSKSDLLTAVRHYERAFDTGPDLPNAFGAAVTKALLGDGDAARILACKVISLFGGLKSPAFSDRARLGIAFAVLSNVTAARDALELAQDQLGGPSEDCVPFIRILDDLRQHVGLGDDTLSTALVPPQIAVFTGHTLDRPNTDQTCLPEILLPDLKTAIATHLAEMNITIGYSLPRCGSDILFIEALQERGAEVHVILPYNRDDFMDQSVHWAGADWTRRVETALDRANSISYATVERFLGHDALNRFANQYLHGLALLRAAFLHTDPYLLAVWDMDEGSLPGGAAEFIDQWEDIARLRIVDLDTMREDAGIDVAPPARPKQQQDPPKDTAERDVRTLLFADIVGFSRLEDDVVPQFLDFYEELFKELKAHAPRAATINTWGDAFFIVMDNATSMVEFGIAMLAGFRTAQNRFGAEIRGLDLRVSLHAGPVFSRFDPFRQGRNFYGAHINRAARLEPVTIPGQIYATQQFVALLTVEEAARRHEALMTGQPVTQSVTCSYVGVVALAKNFGRQAVYHIRPT